MRRRGFRLSDRARQDLADIHGYVACDSPEAADRLITQISSKIAWAAESGYGGVARNWIAEGLRALLVGSYCIYFTIDGDIMTVSRVLHGAREVRLQSFSEDS